MNLGLSGKVVVVAGASRGIGFAAAEAFAAEGARLVLAGRNPGNLAAAAAKLVGEGAEVEAVTVDVETKDGAQALVDAALARFGQLDVLVNNSGGSGGGTFAENVFSDFESGFERNFWPALRASKAALPALVRSKGCIVNVLSIWGREAGGKVSYNVAKAALQSLTKAMGRELAPQGVRAVGVAPGSILHPGGSWERRLSADPEGINDFVRRDIPAGRFGAAREVGDVICFLASERANWITGSVVVVDGGQSRAF